MKRFLIATLACILLMQPAALPQVTRERLEADPLIAMDVYRMYEYSGVPASPAPKGYKATYLSHYGRHGERYVNRPKYIVPGLEVLRREELTPLGEKALRIVQDMADRSEGHWGDLTPLADVSIGEITGRMYKRDRGVFRPGRLVRCQATTEPRCLLTMTRTAAGLAALCPRLKLTYEANAERTKVLAGCLTMADTCAYIQDAKRDSIFAASPEADSWVANLFKEPGQLSGKDIVDVTGSIVFVWKDYPNLGLPLFDLSEFLTEEKIYLWTRAQTARSFSIYCRSRWWNGCLDLMRPLLEDFVTKADEALERGDIAADLRFGQDYVLMSLFSVLRLRGHERNLDYDEIPEHWDIASWCPISGSLQLIFYTRKNSPVLVKLLINEKETDIPVLEAVSGPYYLWSDVKDLMLAND